MAALLAAAARPGPGARTLAAAHPEPVSWRRFAEEVGRALGRSARLVRIPRGVAVAVALAAEAAGRATGRAAVLNREKVRELTQRRWVCDAAPAIRELGWTPRFPVERGVPTTAAWYEEAGWL